MLEKTEQNQNQVFQPLNEFLNKEFSLKKQSNPKYSMRAFARDLELSSAYLSQLLTGKRKLSFEKALEVSEKLSLTKEKQKEFLANVRADQAKTRSAKNQIEEEWTSLKPQKPLDFKELPKKSLETLSSWHTTAVLEALLLRDIKPSTSALSRRLGVSRQAAKEALEVLKVLGLVGKTGSSFERIKQAVKWPSLPSRAIRKIHSEYLDLAKQAIEEQSFSERNISGSVFAIDKEDYPEYEKLINEFRARMIELSQKKSNRSAVYRLSVQFFRLDKDKS